MGREVRRVPMGWQHPMEWRERWDRSTGRTSMTLVPRALFDDYPGALADWERRGAALAARTGHDWEFRVEYHLTGYEGHADSGPTVHPFDVWDDDTETAVEVRDEDHLHELLLREHESERPDPADYMPGFPAGTATGWCMYETTSEGTPISPVFETPEELAQWLANTGASTFGDQTAAYETWLRMIIGSGWAPSVAVVDGSLSSGVEFMAGGGHS